MNAVKTYHNFHSGIRDLCTISPIIDNIMRYPDGSLPRTHESATIQVLKSFERNPPSFRRSNPNAHAINMTKDGVSCKLNGQISFGWSIDNSRNNVVYPFRISINSNNHGLYKSNELKKAQELHFNIYDSKFHQKSR